MLCGRRRWHSRHWRAGKAAQRADRIGSVDHIAGRAARTVLGLDRQVEVADRTVHRVAQPLDDRVHQRPAIEGLELHGPHAAPARPARLGDRGWRGLFRLNGRGRRLDRCRFRFRGGGQDIWAAQFPDHQKAARAGDERGGDQGGSQKQLHSRQPDLSRSPMVSEKAGGTCRRPNLDVIRTLICVAAPGARTGRLSAVTRSVPEACPVRPDGCIRADGASGQNSSVAPMRPTFALPPPLPYPAWIIIGKSVARRWATLMPTPVSPW